MLRKRKIHEPSTQNCNQSWAKNFVINIQKVKKVSHKRLSQALLRKLRKNWIPMNFENFAMHKKSEEIKVLEIMLKVFKVQKLLRHCTQEMM